MKRNVFRIFVFLFAVIPVIVLNTGLPDVFGAGKSGDQASGKNPAIEYRTVYPGVYDKDEQELLDITREFGDLVREYRGRHLVRVLCGRGTAL